MCDVSGGSTALLSTTYYWYNDIGNPERIITEKADPQGEPRFEAVWLKYAKNGETVNYVIGESWDAGCTGTYHITYANQEKVSDQEKVSGRLFGKLPKKPRSTELSHERAARREIKYGGLPFGLGSQESRLHFLPRQTE